MRNEPTRGFELRTIVTAYGRRSVGRFVCSRCQDVLDIAYVGTKPPIFFVQKARQQGWAAHEKSKARAFCPNCLTPPKENKETKEMDVVRLPAAPRLPSADERLRIRRELDAHFDDARGEFLGGMTDRRIAELLNLPAAMVTSIREAAYGPIRISPEITELRQQLGALKKNLGEIEKKLAAIEAAQ